MYLTEYLIETDALFSGFPQMDVSLFLEVMIKLSSCGIDIVKNVYIHSSSMEGRTYFFNSFRDWHLLNFSPYNTIGMSSIVDKSTIISNRNNQSNRLVGYRIEIINVLYPNNGV